MYFVDRLKIRIKELTRVIESLEDVSEKRCLNHDEIIEWEEANKLREYNIEILMSMTSKIYSYEIDYSVQQ